MGNKVGKLIIRVIYIAFAVIIVVLSSIIFFNTAKGDHILSITNQALTDKNYGEIQKLFGGIYASEPSVKLENEKGNILVTASGAEKDVLYYPEENGKASLYHKFLRTYDFYIFNASFGTSSVSVNGVKTNNVGVKFITDKIDETTGEAVTYLFPFIVTNTVNGEVYKEKYDSLENYFLNYGRDFVSDKTRYGFFNFAIYEDTLNYIEQKTSGNIVGFNITDNEGNNVYANNFDFDFSFTETFYNEDEAGVVFNAYNEYLPYYDTWKFSSSYNLDNKIENLKDETYNTKTEAFNSTIEAFNKDLAAGQHKSVLISYKENEIMTGDVIAKAVWRTIGIEALILLVVVVIYILLFHFQQLRDFIFRNEKRTPIRPKFVNKEPEQEAKPGFKYNQANNKKADSINVKPTEIKEEAKVEETKSEANTDEAKEEVNTEAAEETKTEE